MDPFTQRMLERAKARKEKLEAKLPPSELAGRQRQPLTENNLSELNIRSPYKSTEKKSPISISSDIVKLATSDESDVAVQINIVHQNNVQVEVQVEEREVTLSEYLKETQKAISPEKRKSDTEKSRDIDELAKCEKENVTVENDKKANLREGAKSRLKKLGALYSEDGVLSSPIHQSKDLSLDDDTSKMSAEVKSPAKSTNNDDKPRARKFGRLAALAEEISSWEDDMSRHEIKSASKPTSNNKAPQLKTTPNTSNNRKSLTKKAETTPKPSAASKFISASPSKPLNSPVKAKNDIASPKRLSKAPEPPKFNSPNKSAKLNVKDLASAIENKAEPIKNDASKLTPKGTGLKSVAVTNSSPKPFQPQIVGSSPKKSPNKWERSVLDDLEAQGFKRQSNGRSRLVYTFEGDMATVCAPPALDRKPSLKKRPAPPPPPPPYSSASSTSSSNYGTPETARKEDEGELRRRDPHQLSVRDRTRLFENRHRQPITPSPSVGDVKKVAANNKSSSNLPAVHNAQSREKTAALAMNIISSEKKTLAEQSILDKWAHEKNEDMKVINRKFHSNSDLDAIEHDNPNEDQANENSPLMGLNHASSISNLSPKRLAVVNSPKVVVNQPTNDIMSEDTDAPRLKRMSMDSPHVVSVLEDVKKVKVGPPLPGKLYPSLQVDPKKSDDESESCLSSLNSSNSSVNAHVEEDWGNTSFGREVLQAAGVSKTPETSKIATPASANKRLLDSSDENCNLDDLLDEAFDYDNDGPTPPKQNKGGIQTSNSFYYAKGADVMSSHEVERFKSPMKTPTGKKEDVKVINVDGVNKPLTHTVSFYRKQQSQTQPPTPVRVVRIEIDDNDGEQKERAARKQQLLVQESHRRVKELLDEVSKQNTMILQASQALNLCMSTVEFSGSTEQAEGERLLLLASHRRQACLHEVQRIQVEGVSAPSPHNYTLIIEELSLPLRREYVRQLNADGALGHYIVCLVKCQERVLATAMMKTVPESFTVTFSDRFRLEGLDADFKVTVEMYALQASKEVLPHDVKYHINTKKSGKLATPRKGARSADLKSPLPMGSPGGPNVVRSPAMQLQGYCIFSAQQCNRSNFTLSKASVGGPLEGCLRVKITCERHANQTPQGPIRRGFLTMFEEAGGFGAWHRRWCVLHSTDLSYWRYPDDEKKKTPMGSIELSTSVNDTVMPAPRDLCARQHTLLLETTTEPNLDESVTGETASSLINANGRRRYLLAADTRQERDAWTDAFNEALKTAKENYIPQ